MGPLVKGTRFGSRGKNPFLVNKVIADRDKPKDGKKIRLKLMEKKYCNF
jgi:hypothetical protein